MISWANFFKTQTDEFYQSLGFEIVKINIGEQKSRICIHEDFYHIQENHSEIFECPHGQVRDKVRDILIQYQTDLLRVRLKAFDICERLDIDRETFLNIKKSSLELLHTLVALPTHFDNDGLWQSFPIDFTESIEQIRHAKISSEGMILASDKFRSLKYIEIDKDGKEYWDPIIDGVRRGHDYFSYAKCLVSSGHFNSVNTLMNSKVNHEGLHDAIDDLLSWELKIYINGGVEDFQKSKDYNYTSFIDECLSKVFDSTANKIKLSYNLSLEQLNKYVKMPQQQNYDVNYVYGPKVLENIAKSYFDTAKLFIDIDRDEIFEFLRFLFDSAKEFKHKSTAKDDFLKQIEFLLYLDKISHKF